MSIMSYVEISFIVAALAFFWRVLVMLGGIREQLSTPEPVVTPLPETGLPAYGEKVIKVSPGEIRFEGFNFSQNTSNRDKRPAPPSADELDAMDRQLSSLA